MLIDFTEFELETIYNSLDDYIHYDDEDELPENLIGGLSVANRVESIQNKIDLVFKINKYIHFNIFGRFYPLSCIMDI